MANNVIKRIWNQNKMVSIEALQGMAFQAEDGGHTFEISGVDDHGNPVALSGTVAGIFRRPDNADIALTGAASGGKVSVTLTDDCYAVPGRFALTVFVTSNNQKVAVYAAIGTVASTSGGAVAGSTPQDVVDLILAIAAAVATIPPSYSGLIADIAPTYSDSALYPIGAYAYYDGDLYRCTTPITTAETWTAAHWTAAVLGKDVGELKNALKMNAELDGYSTVETDFHKGSFTTTGFNTDPTRCYMLIEQVGRGSKFIFDSSLVFANYFYVVSAADLTRIYTPNVWDNSGVLNLNYANNGTVVILLKDANDSSARISDHLSEVNARTQLYTYTRRAINWVAFGDSITHGSYSIAGGGTNNAPEYSYAYRIAKHLEPNKIGDFYNCGIRGLGWVKTGNNGETFADMLALYTGNKSIIELVTVMLGINDYISQENLGTIESSENDGTISGAIRSGLHTICTQYPGAKIFAISPLNSSYYGNVDNGWARNVRLNAPGSLQDVSDMIAYWADYFGVEYINELSESYITRYNINDFLLDHLHPSDEGQWMLARDIAQKIF